MLNVRLGWDCWCERCYGPYQKSNLAGHRAGNCGKSLLSIAYKLNLLPLACSSHGLISNPFFVVFFLCIFRERPPTIGKAEPTFQVGGTVL